MWVCKGEELAIEGVGVGGETEDTGDLHHSWSLIPEDSASINLDALFLNSPVYII